ncbi:hypothetical protein Mkiyose1385_61050 [Mycobacterium kiyosense]|nr:hypothetical protein SRL2020448_60320 [Mycobacterium kiyosense]GLD22006.1 hypothetical protein Mkiyose1385_61050 [Mycobacterium kiyosense]GLD28117.1 hypothetical protein Mkiyose1386_61100 [Mycobacterium kiyosense]
MKLGRVHNMPITGPAARIDLASGQTSSGIALRHEMLAEARLCVQEIQPHSVTI